MSCSGDAAGCHAGHMLVAACRIFVFSINLLATKRRLSTGAMTSMACSGNPRYLRSLTLKGFSAQWQTGSLYLQEHRRHLQNQRVIHLLA
jgi:hypothetical protein